MTKNDLRFGNLLSKCTMPHLCDLKDFSSAQFSVYQVIMIPVVPLCCGAV